MKTSLLLSTFLCVATQAVAAVPAYAQPNSNPALKDFCTKLTSFYDRFGASRSENSDGARNMTRIGAGIECERGQYEAGISSMESLLREKKFAPVPQPAAVAQARQFGQNPLPGPERASQ